MPKITFPDGNEKNYESATTGLDIATDISPGLAKRCIAVMVNGETQDLGMPITEDATVRLLTLDNNDPDALAVLNHSAAHVLAEAICDLFPGTKLAYGPNIENGFFYDLATEKTITVDDFEAIEKRMQEIIKEDRPFVRCEYNHEEGLERVAGDKYKTDNAQRAIERGSEKLSFYVTGEKDNNFEDLCGGPHVPRTGVLAASKVMSVSGSFWHGDQNSDQLTRVYGTCWADKKGLKKYLNFLEEAKKRDHRRIGPEMDLFHIDDENPGQIFWHHRGWTLYRIVENYVREKVLENNYIEVKTPHLQPQVMWERSGHWAKYRENMFVTSEHDRGGNNSDDSENKNSDSTEKQSRLFAIKPMNCPGHIGIFKQGIKSYRDLPQRMAEFGACVRYEPSGALHGIMRVRGFVQDDGHIFCTEEQIGSEVADFCSLLKEMYTDFGFDVDTVKVKFSTRPEVRVGKDEDWDRAEAALEKAVNEAGLETVLNPGEGAFYGPKLEFTLVDCLGREWQCGTIQVDYQLNGPDRLNATYVAEDGSKKHPILLHRAILGSLERFIGILIENYAGKFPLWLAPEQIRLLSVTDDQLEYAKDCQKKLVKAGLRTTVDSNSEKLGAKIRNARNDRVNYFAVLGEKEVESNTVTLQRQNGDRLGSFSIDELIEGLKLEAISHGKELLEKKEAAPAS